VVARIASSPQGAVETDGAPETGLRRRSEGATKYRSLEVDFSKRRREGKCDLVMTWRPAVSHRKIRFARISFCGKLDHAREKSAMPSSEESTTGNRPMRPPRPSGRATGYEGDPTPVGMAHFINVIRMKASDSKVMGAIKCRLMSPQAGEESGGPPALPDEHLVSASPSRLRASSSPRSSQTTELSSSTVKETFRSRSILLHRPGWEGLLWRKILSPEIGDS
jgi:hypothetical protein